MTHKIVTHKSKATAFLLGFFLGGLGIHRFYLGHNTVGVCYLVMAVACVILAPAIGPIIAAVALIDSIVILCQPKTFFRRVNEVEVVA